MKRSWILGRLVLGLALAFFATITLAQTSTPTPTNTPTPTFTPSPQPAKPTITLTVPNGLTTSNWAQLNEGQIHTLTVYAPATLAETVTFEVSDTAAGTVFRTFQTPIGTDATVAAGKAVVLTDVGAVVFRVKLNGNAAAARTFTVMAVRKLQ